MQGVNSPADYDQDLALDLTLTKISRKIVYRNFFV